MGSWTTRIAGGVVGIVSQLLSLLLEFFTFFVFAFCIAADGPRIRRAIGRWMPPERQEVFVTVWDIAAQKTGGYVISKIVLAALSAGFHAMFFWAIGVPYWLPLALLVGITAQFIPVVGTYIGIAVPLLFVVFTSPLTAVWIIVFATVYQQIETYLFTPRVSRRTMDVNSGIALAAVFIGAAIWGPIGALIGIPLAAAVVAVVGTYGRRYELVPQLAAPELDDEEAHAMRADLGLDHSGLETVVRGAFSLLELIAFFTADQDKPAQSWHTRLGSSAWQAAGLIHSDMQRGFVRAEVVPWEELVDAGGYAGARERGTLRIEGRNYRLADGDVFTVRFTP